MLKNLKICFFCALALGPLSTLVVFAKPTEILDFTKELKTEELPWFAFDAKDKENGNYDKVINSDKLKELIKQKNYRRVVFAFFATWCAPCLEGLKKMSDNSEQLKKNGVLVLLVSVAEKDMETYSRKKIDEWLKQKKYLKDEWQLVFDPFNNSLEDFGLHKDRKADVPLPKTLVTDGNLRPVTLIGAEGDDFLQILMK
ncbi:MAG: redoxin domain-containing protein [Fibromonadaceae bacterium]|jgi:thiol-disulfide isomerase/thioredoxin|nr:redoxin domain-containing protein [Fibromonadaceae bacterium]